MSTIAGKSIPTINDLDVMIINIASSSNVTQIVNTLANILGADVNSEYGIKSVSVSGSDNANIGMTDYGHYDAVIIKKTSYAQGLLKLSYTVDRTTELTVMTTIYDLFLKRNSLAWALFVKSKIHPTIEQMLSLYGSSACIFDATFIVDKNYSSYDIVKGTWLMAFVSNAYKIFPFNICFSSIAQ